MFSVKHFVILLVTAISLGLTSMGAILLDNRHHVLAAEVLVPDLAPPETTQKFDQMGMGAGYVTGTHSAIAVPPKLLTGGPSGGGKFLRLAFGTPTTTANQNTIDFDSTGLDLSKPVVADFDFRITPGTGRADGFGFALLDIATYGVEGVVAPGAPVYAAEEPNFAGSLGVGFDIYRSTEPEVESNNNHVSIHYDGRKLAEIDVTPVLDLVSSQWVHAQIVINRVGADAEITVALTQYGRPTQNVIEQLVVKNVSPYTGRVHFGARAGGLTADFDLDNVRVQSFDSMDSIVGFASNHYVVVETEDSVAMTVHRTGSINSAATVPYSIGANDATPGLDYTGSTGTLSFASGERSIMLSVPINDDLENEGDESFYIELGNPSGTAVVGGPALAKVTIIDNERAAEEGHWSDIIPSEVIPIQAHMLPTGKVMYWDRRDLGRGWDPNPRLWDPVTETITRTAIVDYELFCSGHSFLADGTLLVTGGHIDDVVGDDEASIYNPFSDTWSRREKMNNGRWYPSNVTLPNGDVLVLGGTYKDGGDNINKLPQVWDTAKKKWRNLTTAQQGGLYDYADYYPFLYTAPNGKVFNAGPQRTARYLDTSGKGSWSDVAASSLLYRDYGTSVMYDVGKVLIVGGNRRDPDLDNPTVLPSKTAEVIDLNTANPAWRSVAAMNFRRRHLNATLLPDGTVLVTGGSSVAGFDNEVGAVLEPELWDPKQPNAAWQTMAPHASYRGYHSVALLLPDARVLIGGGGHPDPAGGAQYNFEIFWPPYLFKGPRPIIEKAPPQVKYNQDFVVQTPDAGAISRVTWVRLSSVTHSFNQNQRINELEFEVVSGGVKVRSPENPNLAPPGHYMLFILDENGVPSEAQIIRVYTPSSTFLPYILKSLPK